MSTPSTINKMTIIKIRVRLPGDEEEGDQGEGDPMETGCRTDLHIQKQRQEEQGFNLISCTSSCISDHPGED